MADYRSVRFKVKVKPEYITEINNLIFGYDYLDRSPIKLFSEFGQLQRADNIFGTQTSYAPKEWDEDLTFFTSDSIGENGLWCSKFSIVTRHIETLDFLWKA